MKICLVALAFYPAVVYGGPIFSSWRSARALARLGHRVSVSTTDANGDGRLDVSQNRWTELEPGLRVRYYRDTVVGRFSLSMMLNLWRDVRDADVVQAEGLLAVSTAAAAFWATLFGKPLLLTPRGTLGGWGLRHSGATRLKSIWLRFVTPLFARRVTWQATSERERDDIRRRFPGARVVTIPNPVDLSEFREARRTEAGEFAARFLGTAGCVEPPSPIVVSLGRLHAIKGFAVLIEAFARLAERKPGAVLAIAGPDEGERGRLESLAASLGVSDRVFLVGPLWGADKVDFLAGGDVFALASHHENFGVAYAEALAAGTPVVASRHAPWSTVEQQGCGRWVDNDPESFADAILEVLESDPIAMGARGRVWVAREFGLEQVGARLARALEAMVR